MKFLNQVQRITLLIFFFSINFEVWNPLGNGGDFSIAKLTAMLYFISIAPQLPQFFRISNLKSLLTPIWVFFCFLTIMSIFNINELYSKFFSTSIFLNIIIFWILINHERKDYLIIEKGMLSFAFGSFALSLLYFAGIGVEYTQGRLSMFGDNQNALGLKMAIAVIIILTSVAQNRLNFGWYRYLLLILVPFMLTFIGATGSRVAAIAFVLAFITAILLFKTKNNLTKIFTIIGGGIILIFLVILIIQSGTLLNRLEDTSKSGDLGERDMIWRTISPIIVGNPFFGIGETGYEYETTAIFGNTVSPHNVILEVICYTGFFGLIIYSIFLYRVFLRSYQSYLTNGWLLPILLTIPVIGSILSGQILDVKIGWIIFSYIISTSAIKNTNEFKINEIT